MLQQVIKSLNVANDGQLYGNAIAIKIGEKQLENSCEVGNTWL